MSTPYDPQASPKQPTKGFPQSRPDLAFDLPQLEIAWRPAAILVSSTKSVRVNHRGGDTIDRLGLGKIYFSHHLAGLTMMVNTRNVSRFTGALPTSPMNADREIVGGPLYSPAEVLSLLNTRGVEGLKAWTKGCIEDLQKWELDLDDVLELVRLCLHGGQFLGAEWCIQKPGGPWAACDAYRVCRREWVKATFKEMDFEYYIKFAIGKTGQLLLLTSCHPSEDRW